MASIHALAKSVTFHIMSAHQPYLAAKLSLDQNLVSRVPVILVAFPAYVTSLVANIAGLAGGFRAIASNVSCFITGVTTLHRESS